MNSFSTEHFMLPSKRNAENTSVYILCDSKSSIVKLMKELSLHCVLKRIVF